MTEHSALVVLLRHKFCITMIQFVIADPSHTETVAAMLEGLFQDVEHDLKADEIAERFEEIDSDERHSTVLAYDEENDEYVGLITVTESLALYAGGRIGVINELYVEPDYRSEGVGKMLLDAVKDLARERGWVRLELTTPGDEFEKTLRFYQREGFMRIGPRFKFHVGADDEE